MNKFLLTIEATNREPNCELSFVLASVEEVKTAIGTLLGKEEDPSYCYSFLVEIYHSEY